MMVLILSDTPAAFFTFVQPLFIKKLSKGHQLFSTEIQRQGSIVIQATPFLKMLDHESLVSVSVASAAVAADASEDWQFPLLLSFLAGASTCAGAAIVFLFDAAQIEKSMTFSLSLAASVMITVSVISIGPECMEGIITWGGDASSLSVDWPVLLERLLCFGGGCFGYWLLSKALAAFPEPESLFFLQKSSDTTQPAKDQNYDEEKSLIVTTSPRTKNRKESLPSPTKSAQSEIYSRRGNSSISYSDDEAESDVNEKSKKSKEEDASRKRSWRVAMLLFFSLLFHNFPEGLAVVASTVESRQLGITVAIGILIHNIPEGIAIAVPCIAARPDAPWLAFWLASGSGLAEPLGALVALSILRTGKLPMENVLACVAGIMCTVSIVELYPEACRHLPAEGNGSNKKSYRSLVSGTLVGMSIMIATEWYLP